MYQISFHLELWNIWPQNAGHKMAGPLLWYLVSILKSNMDVDGIVCVGVDFSVFWKPLQHLARESLSHVSSVLWCSKIQYILLLPLLLVTFVILWDSVICGFYIIGPFPTTPLIYTNQQLLTTSKQISQYHTILSSIFNSCAAKPRWEVWKYSLYIESGFPCHFPPLSPRLACRPH